MTISCLEGFYFNSQSVEFNIKGYVYIEAMTLPPVNEALQDILYVFHATPPKLVPIGEMTETLKIKRDPASLLLKKGTWVRIKRGTYANDLAQVLAPVDEDGRCMVKLVPRLLYKDDIKNNSDDDQAVNEVREAARQLNQQAEDTQKRKKKRKKPFRPPRRFFDKNLDLERLDPKIPVRQNGATLHYGNQLIKNGYVHKSYLLSYIVSGLCIYM